MVSGWRSLVTLGSATLLLGLVDIPPIVTAAKDGDWNAVRALVEQGADVNAISVDGSAALHWASYWNRADIADLLLSSGANARAVTDLGVTPLWPAAQNGSALMVDRLLEAGADPDAALLSGETVVMTAALTGNADVVRRLLAAGADPNGFTTRGQTALMWAAGQGHSEVVEALLEFGADVAARTEVRRQFMKTDKEQESHPDYQVWVNMGGNTPLVFAARAGDLRSVEALVGAGADVEETTAFGITATMMAAHGGNPAVVEYLLQRGADSNAAAAGHTALHVAILRGNESAVRALLAHGADPNALVERATPTRRQSLDYHLHPTWVGATPLWLAARFTEPSIMRLLLERGADPLVVHEVSYPTGDRETLRIQQEGGITLLMAAVGMGNRSLRRGFYQPPPREAESMTLEAVRIAVSAGVDVDAKDSSGRTASDAARARRYDDVVAFLAEYAAATLN